MSRKVVRFSVLIIVCTVILTAFSGCSSYSGPKSNNSSIRSQTGNSGVIGRFNDKPRIALITILINHPIFKRIKAGLDRAGEEYDFVTSISGPEDTSTDKVIEAMEIAIAEKVDGIVIYPMSPAAFTPVLEKAKKAGIKVGCFFADAERSDLRISFVGTDSRQCGYDQVKAIYEKVRAPLKMGVVVSATNAQDELNQVEGAKEFLKSIPESKIVSMDVNNGDALKSSELLLSMVKSNPDINSVFVTDGAGVIGFSKAIERMKPVNPITVVAMDDLEQNLELIREGKIYGIMAQGFDEMGYLNGKYVSAAIRGEEYEEVTLIPAKFVNRDNIDTYMTITK
jgi:ABC-type sugar transport system, periplasmic component